MQAFLTVVNRRTGTLQAAHCCAAGLTRGGHGSVGYDAAGLSAAVDPVLQHASHALLRDVDDSRREYAMEVERLKVQAKPH